MNKPSKKKIAKLFLSGKGTFLMSLLSLLAIGCCVLLFVGQMPDRKESTEADNVPDSRRAVLTASSTERDMRVVVRDETGHVITGEQFPITLTFPNGDSADYITKTDGSCYIVELSPGEYTVRMGDTAGYISSDPVKCSVRAEAEYVPIQNISQVIDIVDIGELSPNEIKAQPALSEQSLLVPEEIVTSPEGTVPVTDSLGHPMYSYTFHLGPNGYILYRGTEQESDVLPVDENKDGIPEYGLRHEGSASEDPDAGSESAKGGQSISVALYNADNTPVDLYAIDAVPLTEPADTVNGIAGWKRENGHTYYYGSDGQKEVGLKKIDGRLYYFNARGEKADSLGIDVSCFNGHINWEAVKSQGIDFAIVRVGGRGWSSGRVYEDTFLLENLAGARNAGLKTGVYFYSTAINTVEAVQEASVVIEKLKGMHLDYPVFIDMEFSGSYPRGRADRLGTAVRVDIANAFCRTVISSGYAAGIYAGEYYMNSCMDYRSVSQYTYWLANYTEGNAMPGFSGRYDLWQFTNAGQMNGISGTVDLNVIF